MRLLIDLTGSTLLQDDLDYLADAQQAVLDLLLPDAELERLARARLCLLLQLLEQLRQAVCTAHQPTT
ncbi:MAG: hypothetical protein WAT67_09455 [Candidatus Contendobacter sp.]